MNAYFIRAFIMATFLAYSAAHATSQENAQPKKWNKNMKKIARSAIKSVDINAPVDKVFDYLSNPTNWPQWAVVNLVSISPGEGGWFNTVTKFGKGQLRVSAVKEFGIFDHIWTDPQASWIVPARVVRNNDGATVMWTIFQPPIMTDMQFDEAMREMDLELKTLKEIMER